MDKDTKWLALLAAAPLLAGCAATRPLDSGPFPVEYDRIVKEWAAKQKAFAPIQSMTYPVKAHGKENTPGWQVMVETKFGGPPKPTITMEFLVTIRDGIVVDARGTEDEVSYRQGQ